MTLIELIVKRGANAVDALPTSIKQDPTAVAETIENNLRKLIVDQQPTNPKYFENMSALLNELIQLRRTAAQNYQAYLQQVETSVRGFPALRKVSKRIVELSKQVVQPSNSS